MLVYPELNCYEDFEHLNEIVAPVEKFFEEGSKFMLYFIFRAKLYQRFNLLISG